ncbi:DNA repair protein XRCC4 [Periplaneta americana]|uniref:DNA repair protein XRCC4 n=1 Tax=Periplaneta americana TaxID=6978 RepID=UPI0037E96F2D
MNTTVSCLPQESEEGSYRIRVEWKDDSFNILLLHNGSAWSGHASYNHVERISRSLDLSVEDYITETKAVLSTQGGAHNFTYVIEDDQFIWKKQDQQTKIKIKYGYIDLEKAPILETGEKMLDSLLEQCSNLKAKVLELQEINTRTTKERGILMEKLVEYKKQKLKMEKDLLSRFLAVLNSKKEYIRQIEKKLTDNVSINNHEEDAHFDDSDDPKPSNSKANKPKQAERDSDHYDSDTEVEDTDEELKASTPPRVDTDFPDDDDLLQDVKPSVSIIPKRTARAKRTTVRTLRDPVAGPSMSKVTRPTLENGHAAEFNTQDLLDEF